MTKCSKKIYTKYSDELKKALLQDDIKFLKVYGDNNTCVEYKRIEYGYWIWHGSYYTCSVCGEEQYGVDTGRYYCQNCGAKMEVDDE